MTHQREDILSRATVLSDRLNKYLESYLKKTADIGKLLNSNEDEEGAQLVTLFEDRQGLIEQYDVLKKEYIQLLHLAQGNSTGEQIDELAPDGNPKITLNGELGELQNYRSKLLADIKKLDDQNQQPLQLQLEDHKVKLKQVGEGRLLLNTYFGNTVVHEGVFIDKRE